jgi:hypothetical protein
LKRYANKKHIAWIQNRECILIDSKTCEFQVQAHHLLRTWIGVRGMGRKSDDRNLVPLCHKHHTELHQLGNEDKFWVKYNKDKDYGRRLAQHFWIHSAHHEIILT